MQNPPPNDDVGHADDIFSTAVYEAPKPLKKIFLPWHKPRKQFVRHHQWCEEMKSLLEETQPDGNTLKYLGLPGVDLLDLRYFHAQVCEPMQLRLRFLGFNSGANPKSEFQTDLNISLDEVRKLSMIDPLSEIICDDFCLVANASSMAWRKTKDLGPYDIINLDLCDGFGVHQPGALDNTHYNAVNRLLSLQAKNKHPWLLFLTTRTGKQDIHGDLLQKFHDKYKQNLANCEAFRQVSLEGLNIGDAGALTAAADTPDGHLTVFLTGLCKWMLGLAVFQNPPSKFKVLSTIGYRINADAGHDDIVSLALKFEPTFVPVGDPLGLANHPIVPPDECDLSAKVLKRLVQRICADTVLADDPDLKSKMTVATEKLLELARYDVAAYQKWLQAG